MANPNYRTKVFQQSKKKYVMVVYHKHFNTTQITVGGGEVQSLDDEKGKKHHWIAVSLGTHEIRKMLKFLSECLDDKASS